MASLPAQAFDRILTVINDGAFPVKSMAFSPSGADRWFTMGGGPIDAGERGQARVSMPTSACVFDFRVRFSGGTAQDIRGWNACRDLPLHVGGQAASSR